MKFKNNLNYHLTCFYCVYCQYRFNVGDNVYIPKPNIILCQRHWMQEPTDSGPMDSSDSIDSLFDEEEDDEAMDMLDNAIPR